jgi:hypothetical protein
MKAPAKRSGKQTAVLTNEHKVALAGLSLISTGAVAIT